MRTATVAWMGLALAAVVLLAGCGAVDSRSSANRSTSTLTPAPVPEETGPAGGRLLAPGLSTRGVFDADALVEAHRTTLTERGFDLTRNRTVVRPSGTAGARTRPLDAVGLRAVVGPGADAYHLSRVERSTREWPVADSYTSVAVWYHDPVVRNRFVDERRDARYWGEDRAASGGPILDPTRAEGVRRDLLAVDLRVVGNETVGGVTVYRLEGSRLEEPSELVFPPLLSDPHNASMVARVDERGVVGSYTLAFDARFDGGPVRVRRTHRVTAVGRATVDRPGWLARANESVADERR